MTPSLPHVLIIGRPNVGKSSLFNRLVGRKAAIVHNRRGVTRDIKTEIVARHGLRFLLSDTAGMEETLEQIRHEDTMPHDLAADIDARQMITQTLNQVHVVLMMLDAQKGLTAGDQEIVQWLRRFNRPVIVLLNKSEGRLADPVAEAYRLGFNDVLPISATHNQGIAELLIRLAQYVSPAPNSDIIDNDPAAKDTRDPTAIAPLLPQKISHRRLAILGRPNVGKSTISNSLSGQTRVVTGNIAGLTRDANTLAWPSASDDTQQWHLVDTAGLRAHGQYRDSLDRATAEATWEAINLADVVALVIEATAPLTRGDLSIAKDCARLGRPMLLIVNKIDLVDDAPAIAEELRHQLVYDLAQLRHVPYVCISAHMHQGLEHIAPLARLQAERAARRIGTGTLNRWLEQMLAAHPPPLIKGRRLRLKYATQTEVSPPQFVFFSSQKASVPEAYIRYLRNGLIDDFEYDGIPLRLSVRSARNPYDRSTIEESEGSGSTTSKPRQKHVAHTKRLPTSQQRRISYSTKPKKALSLKGRAKTELQRQKTSKAKKT